jgi:hypothetical protein
MKKILYHARFYIKIHKKQHKGKKNAWEIHIRTINITSVLKVETDIITSFTESLIEQAVIPVLMYVEIQN